MLFSEPKIPQSTRELDEWLSQYGFSALQRAENSSMPETDYRNSLQNCFSALQRAENSSMSDFRRPRRPAFRFQCSSASRKFLNVRGRSGRGRLGTVSVLFSEPKIPQFRRVGSWGLPELGFSALQRAENSSIYIVSRAHHQTERFSALQRAENSSIVSSVLFGLMMRGFSALQRAENSSILFRCVSCPNSQ